MSSDGESRFWQKLLGGLATLVLVASIGIYASGKSIEDILFGAESGTNGRVGAVATLEGALKRQPRDSLEFLGARKGEGVFNEDTVMTGSRDTATLQLNDGGVIEMGPSTLIRLSFETAVSIKGIERQVTIDVVEGLVNARANEKQINVRSKGQKIAVPRKATQKVETRVEPGRSLIPVEAPPPEPTASPEPTPEPTPSPEPPPPPPPMALEISPVPGGALSIASGQKPPLKAEFKFSSPNAVSGQVRATTTSLATGKTLSSKVVEMTEGKGSVPLTFAAPGRYRLSLKPEGTERAEEAPVETTFAVQPEFVAIRVESPLVGDRPIDSNKYIGKNMSVFDVKLRWWDFDQATKYRIEMRDSAGKVLVSDETDSTAYSFKKDQVYSGMISYKVSAPLPSGFVAVSEQQSFSFNFSSPPLTEPKDGERVPLNAAKGTLFTWQLTNFTKSYDFEVAADPTFGKMIKSANVKENFLIFRGLKPGTYYWRVRARAGNTVSAPGQANKLIIEPETSP